MATFSHYWKVWLRLNLLTVDIDNDYIAEVSTTKTTLHNEELARRIVAEGSEIKYDTLLSILSQRDRIVRQALQEGSSVLDGVCHLTPRITGTWLGATAKFDPAIHKMTLDIIPSAEMRRALTEVGVEVLGVREGGAIIGNVVDTATGATNGAVTLGDDVNVIGAKIKVTGEAEEVGVYFVNLETKARTKVSRRLTTNDPKQLLARVPNELEAGKYQLEVVTQFSGGGISLKEPRTIVYDRPLYVGITPPTPGGGGDGEDGGGDVIDPTL